MTRLERMVRDADCFVGLYPYPEAPEVRPSVASLRQASAYFRLELDLAVRSGKPAIVFYDQRYRAVLPRLPDAVSYDPQELAGHGGWPNRGKLAAAFTAFCDGVEAARTYQPRAPRERLRREARVGLLLPTESAPGAYTREQLQAVKEVLDDEGLECVTVRLPEVVTPEFLLEVWQLDWAVVDVAAPDYAREILAFLHGQFVPMLRLRRTAPDEDPASGPSPGHVLFGGFEVGYSEDMHGWHDLDSLGAAVREGYAAIDRPEAYIGSIEDARHYFSRAEQRKEHVFLSYSGDDRATVAPIADALERRFRKGLRLPAPVDPGRGQLVRRAPPAGRGESGRCPVPVVVLPDQADLSRGGGADGHPSARGEDDRPARQPRRHHAPRPRCRASSTSGRPTSPTRRTWSST